MKERKEYVFHIIGIDDEHAFLTVRKPRNASLRLTGGQWWHVLIAVIKARFCF